jgi:hypothetical protein
MHRDQEPEALQLTGNGAGEEPRAEAGPEGPRRVGRVKELLLCIDDTKRPGHRRVMRIDFLQHRKEPAVPRTPIPKSQPRAGPAV